MRAITAWLFLAIVWVGFAADAGAQRPAAKGAKASVQPRAIDPWNRPAGSIVDQTARYYVWHDKQGWHIRATAKGLRTFSGTIRTSNAKIKSCVPVGLKDGRQKGIPDVWKVNDGRTQLAFRFRTANKSDGFDFVVDGAGPLEFDLKIDDRQKAAAIFIGAGKRRPAKVPFSLPAAPQQNSKQRQAVKSS